MPEFESRIPFIEQEDRNNISRRSTEQFYGFIRQLISNNIKSTPSKDIIINNNIYKKEISLISAEILMEHPFVNRGIDRFIVQGIGGWIRENESIRLPDRSPTVQPARSAEPRPASLTPDRSRFSSHSGLEARREPSYRSLTVDGVKQVSTSDAVVRVDFTPDGRAHFEPSRMTDSLTRAIQGIMDLLAAIDQGVFVPDTDLFAGTTNINMALIAQRLGFRITDDCRTPEGNIDKNKARYTVVGQLDEIRAKARELEAKYLERLQRRNQRLRVSVAPNI